MDGLISELILRISPLINEYGAWGVFLASFIEEIIVPIPLSFILLSAGFFLLPNTGSFGQVLLDAFFKIGIAGGIGLTLGSGVLYAIAYAGGEPVIEKWGRWFGISWRDIERVKNRVTKSFLDEVLLLVSRVVPILPHSAISFACGVIHYPPRSFFVVTFLGFTIRAFLMGLLGWSFGEGYVAYSEDFARIGSWVIWCVGILIGIFIIHRLIKRFYRCLY